jgi:translation initiation factor IF-1
MFFVSYVSTSFYFLETTFLRILFFKFSYFSLTLPDVIAELLDGQIHPYGSTTIHGVVAKVIVGSHYDPSKKVDLTLEQASFFFYLLELAMEDKNLSHVDGRVQAHNMKLLEDKIVDVIPMLKKFQILDHPHKEEYA